MSERVPSLDIVWSVTNISEEDLACVQERHFQRTDSSLYEQEVIRGFFSPVDALRATALANREFLNIQGYLGSRSLSKENVEELADNLREVLPDSDQTLDDTPTFPTQFRIIGEYKKNVSVITIAGSLKVVNNRHIAKREIAKYVGVALPDDLWLPYEEVTTRVWLAMARGGNTERGMLRLLDATLGEEKGLLHDDVTKFEERKVRVLD